LIQLLGIALAPGAAIMLYIYLKDKHEREPLSLLLISFIYGIFSTMVTLSVSIPVNMFVVLQPDDLIHEAYDAFLKVALVEEFSKFVFVRFILYPNKNFNEPFDGIVYAVMVSMGFATLENLVYVYNYGFETGLLRMFTAVPAHASFGVMMGYFLGLGKFSHQKRFYYGISALLRLSTSQLLKKHTKAELFCLFDFYQGCFREKALVDKIDQLIGCGIDLI
jgi:RsiW-degrading membrane proteinase PrsW (M82 family)